MAAPLEKAGQKRKQIVKDMEQFITPTGMEERKEERMLPISKFEQTHG